MTNRAESALTLRFFGRVFRPSDVDAVGFSLPFGVIPDFARSVAISGRTLGVELKLSSLGDHQIRQAEEVGARLKV